MEKEYIVQKVNKKADQYTDKKTERRKTEGLIMFIVRVALGNVHKLDKDVTGDAVSSAVDGFDSIIAGHGKKF